MAPQLNGEDRALCRSQLTAYAREPHRAVAQTRGFRLLLSLCPPTDTASD